MRKDIEFKSRGARCVGCMYLPDGPEQGLRHPTIVMGHGFSGLKEMLEPYAQRFCESGFAVVTFDYRFYGGSEGEPRCQIFPVEQMEDYRNAITFAGLQPEVDPDRIGIWGTSLSGGHVICVGALDRRVKCIVCQVPLIDGMAILPPETREDVLARLEADRVARFQTGEVTYMAIVAEDGKSGFFPGREAYDVLMQVQELVAPNWENRVTLESIEKTLEYCPVLYLPRISPTPFLMIVAGQDTLTPHEVAISGFESASDPKKLVILPCSHFEAYTAGFEQGAGAAVDWFRDHLA